VAALALAAAVMAAAQETPITRNAQGLWERSNGDSFPVRLSTHLRIVTSGDVIVRGADANQVTFRFEQRVRAPSHEAAAVAMGGLLVNAEASGDLMQLNIVPRSALAVRTRIEITVPRALPSVSVENRVGSVDVHDLNGEVAIVTGGGPIRADRLARNLTARTGVGGIDLGVIGGTVVCESGGGSLTVGRSGGEIDCHTLGGDIAIGQAGGPVEATTEGGNVRVERAAGDVRARSVAGIIDVGQARGMVYADTRNGSIQVGAAAGVKAVSAAGMVRVRGASGPMSLSTMMGNILAELVAGTPLGDSMLAAGSGDVTVLIPYGLGVSVRARNDSGMTPRIISEFPEIEVKSIGLRAPVTGTGAINGGGPVLNVNTNGGVIYLRRAR
jgi:hypothetical protein